MEDAGSLPKIEETWAIDIGTWAFDIGQCVSHKDHPMPSLVMARQRSARGREIYAVRSFASVEPRRDRSILGDSLVDVEPGTGPCQDCLLFNTGMCPGAVRLAAGH